jgi:hypothetical protein
LETSVLSVELRGQLILNGLRRDETPFRRKFYQKFYFIRSHPATFISVQVARNHSVRNTRLPYAKMCRRRKTLTTSAAKITKLLNVSSQLKATQVIAFYDPPGGVIGCSDRTSARTIAGRIVLQDNYHLLPRIPVSVLRQPLLRGGRSPPITRFGSNWRTDRTHQGVRQARRWAGPKKTSAEFADQEC